MHTSSTLLSGATRLLGLAWLVVAGGVSAATPGVDAPPLPGPARAVAVPPVHEERLPNGLTLIVAQRSGLPLVTARVLVRGGTLADPAGRAGLADLTADLLTKGALRGGRPVDATTLARQAEALGSSLDAGAGSIALGVAMTVTTPRLGDALSLMADVLRQPLLSADELQRSREQMSDSLRLALADPSALAGMVARRVHWGAAAGGAVTTPQTLARVQRSDVQAFHRRWVRPDLMALVLVGDLTPARARELAQRWFGRWQPPAQAAPDLPAEPPASTFGAQVLVNLPGAGQSSVVLVSDFSAQGDADRRIGQLANAVLGGGYSARLNQEVRIRRGLAYGASSHAASAERGGMFSARTQTDHRNATQVVQLLRAELARLAEQPPQAEELAARKASLVGGFARQMETTAGLSAQIGELWMQRRPLSGLAGFPAEVESVHSDEVADYARRRWGPAALRVVVVGDLAAAGPAGTAPPAPGAAAEGSAPGFDPQALRLEAAALDLESPSLQPPTR